MEKILNFFSKYNKFIITGGTILAIFSFFDKKLVIASILVFFLASISLFFINKIKNENQRKIVSIIFLLSFAIHILAVLFVFYGNFQPFSDGRGDYLEYNLTATEVANRLSQNNFSIEGLPLGHYYALAVGYLYHFTIPKMIMGELLNAWLVALTIVCVYLIVKELGRSDKEAFITGLIVNIYPSLAFFGSLMLKEAFVVFFSTAAVLMSLVLIKRFSWPIFILFYVSLMGLTNLRFYISTIIIFIFIVCWLLFSDIKGKKKIINAGIMVFFLGFLPMISMVNGLEQGYFAINSILRQLNIKTIIYYREVAYNFRVDDSSGEYTGSGTVDPEKIKAQTPEGVPVPDIVSSKDWGQDSSVNLGLGDTPIKFVKNSFFSFVYAFLGPFPWQLRSIKHIFVLPEILLWWTCLFFITRGVIRSVRSKYKIILPLLLFGLAVMAMVSLYMTNFGLVTRIRMPAFVALICLTSFGFGKLINIKIPFLEKYFIQ